VTGSTRRGQWRVEHQNSDRETPAEWDPEMENITADMEITEAERITEEMDTAMENKIEETAETTAETERIMEKITE
jgi:hypothetical protein